MRVRPFNEAEQSLGSHSSVRCRSDRQLSLIPHSEASQYVFDGVLASGTAQEDVFQGTGLPEVDCGNACCTLGDSYGISVMDNTYRWRVLI